MIDQYKTLIRSCSGLAILYWLKDNIPLRLILAAYDTPNYPRAKYTVPLLKRLTTNEYALKNTMNSKLMFRISGSKVIVSLLAFVASPLSQNLNENV